MLWNQVVTVTGPIRPEQMGTTYVHEHLMVQPQLEDDTYIPYTLQNEAASQDEVRSFAAAGGNTLVEMTPIHYGRDPAAYRRISQKTGVHVICCTGFHKELFMPPWFGEKTDLQLYDILMDEIENGLDGTGVRPGVIKLGTSFQEITALETRAIQAAARVHLETGIPISTHCDRGTMGVEQILALEKLGVDPGHVLLCHIDSAKDIEYAIRLCRMGAFICIDHVGRELADKDAFRVRMILELLDAGCLERVTLAGDMGKRSYLPAYGGAPGLAYILTSLKSALISKIGEAAFRTMLVDNPRRIFGGTL